MFREILDKGLEKGWPESLCNEESQITLFKSPLIRSRPLNDGHIDPRVQTQMLLKSIATHNPSYHVLELVYRCQHGELRITVPLPLPFSILQEHERKEF